jgi:hypothetical protein
MTIISQSAYNYYISVENDVLAVAVLGYVADCNMLVVDPVGLMRFN